MIQMGMKVIRGTLIWEKYYDVAKTIEILEKSRPLRLSNPF